jgi:lipid A 3-O-deacylase
MKRFFRRALFGAPLLLILMPSPSPAQPWQLGPPESVSASVGKFEFLDDEAVESYEMGWEVRFAPRRFRLLPRAVPDVIPVAGAMASSRGVLYPYGGFRLELPLSERWMLGSGLAAGLYYRAHGKNLGGALEFRSHIEMAYRLSGDSRVGLCIYHLSNGGVFDFNPGTESLLFTYTASLRREAHR